MCINPIGPSISISTGTDTTPVVSTRRRQSLGVVVDSQLPHLVAFSEDPLSTGVLLYHIQVRMIRGSVQVVRYWGWGPGDGVMLMTMGA